MNTPPPTICRLPLAPLRQLATDLATALQKDGVDPGAAGVGPHTLEWLRGIERSLERAAQVQADTERLDYVTDECVSLRCQEARNYDDADVYFETIRYFQQAPHERVMGLGATPRAAIDAARQNTSDTCAYCEGVTCTLCTVARTA